MKKVLLTFVMILMVGVLAACSDGEKNPKEATTKEGEAAGDSGAQTIKVVFKDDGPSNPVAVSYYEKLSEGLKKDLDLDVKFDLVEVAQGDYAEKLNLLLYSGEIPDLIYFQGADKQIADQGLLEDLTPYIEDSKYIKSIMNPYNEARLRNYPYLLWIKPLDNRVPVVRKDWFDQASSSATLMENPTVDNYKAFFKEIVQIGDTKNAVTVAGDIRELDYTFDMAFGINKTWLDSEKGFEHYKVSSQTKDKLEFYRQLYEEGLLDPQYLTKKHDTKQEVFYNGETAVIPGTNGKVIDIYNDRMRVLNGEESQLQVLPPAKGEYQGFGATDISKESRGLAISSQSKNKDLVFQVLDYLASPEGQKLDRLGFEGEHYNVVDGKVELTEKYYGDWYARYWEPNNVEFEVAESTPLLGDAAEKSLLSVADYYSEDNSFVLPEEYVAQWDAMENLYKEYSADIITGKKPLEAFDDYVKKWYAAGGESLTKYANDNLK
ncbi:extracellular solute-binding protein [Sporosarcina sp. Sa2YVA2]|uniref:Extracellular solute-binding protein n=1 Tax=Sporosarcina quadrami TaxID=2762234 RepID=A0ABR8U9P3_9BACL|nr:extracellular solute-binding protein [Sporosarcina quadrami]MBD7984525.1 extracellular solute-binding protein [Sporosarcina quadrami]